MKNTYSKWRTELLRLLPIFALLLLALAGFWWSGVSAKKHFPPLNDADVVRPDELKTISSK